MQPAAASAATAGLGINVIFRSVGAVWLVQTAGALESTASWTLLVMVQVVLLSSAPADPILESWLSGAAAQSQSRTTLLQGCITKNSTIDVPRANLRTYTTNAPYTQPSTYHAIIKKWPPVVPGTT